MLETPRRAAAPAALGPAGGSWHPDATSPRCGVRRPATARLYREVIQPDEGHHHELGRRLLARLARSEADQQRARRTSARTLELAEELQELARLKGGIARAPGC